MNPTPIPHEGEPYQNLLTSAETWQAEGQYKEAVILAQTALELFTEKTLRHLYHTRKVNYLKAVFEHFLTNYNLANDKVSRLYIALSGDNIKAEPFWDQLTAHAELRNQLIHEGTDATEVQAATSLKAVRATIDHITQTLATGGAL